MYSEVCNQILIQSVSKYLQKLSATLFPSSSHPDSQIRLPSCCAPGTSLHSEPSSRTRSLHHRISILLLPPSILASSAYSSPLPKSSSPLLSAPAQTPLAPQSQHSAQLHPIPQVLLRTNRARRTPSLTPTPPHLRRRGASLPTAQQVAKSKTDIHHVQGSTAIRWP